MNILDDGSVQGKTFSGDNYKEGYPHPKKNETFREYKERVDNLRKKGFHPGDLSWGDYNIYCVGAGYQDTDADSLIFKNN